eukprot:Blabericola_migrator_1__4610@NODE_2446_length_2747_cov_17_156343_g1530_i0_p3_GENE_NODE_2446_length_2747_cov_17_156343_g1530_i0NODE_2446_length_2747_cov_17_156343_g1530_i0_p3_ORF_typecomplete_len122_score17_22_NODE_2446_length_2747_cov_17_156343_g1530_i0193558
MKGKNSLSDETNESDWAKQEPVQHDKSFRAKPRHFVSYAEPLPQDDLILPPKGSCALKSLGIIVALTHVGIASVIVMHSQHAPRVIHFWTHVVTLLTFLSVLVFWNDVYLDLRRLSRLICM